MQRVSSGSPYEPIIGFSRAIRVENRIIVSGTGPISPDGSTACPHDASGQARRCWEIIKNSIEQLGGTLDDVVKIRTFVVRPQDWEAIGKVQGELFSEIRPAATMVVSGLINPEWLVEIEAEAVLK